MRKVGLGAVLVLILVACVSPGWAVEGGIDREDLSIKAGPTEPGESLSLVWVEALVYPKIVREEKIISLGVRTASKVKEVKAAFDFSSKQVTLTSGDGLTWGSSYKIPEGISEGVHVARYQITGKRGSIQRTVEFFVKKAEVAGGAIPNTSRGEALQSSVWPLTVISSCKAYSGDTVRVLNPGQVLTSISRVYWYKLIFEDGKEGWVSSVDVKEPTDEYYHLGYEAYKTKNYAAAVKYYQAAVEVDPGFVKGHIWLAKSQTALGNLDVAVESVKKALRLDERDIDGRLVAGVLAQKCFTVAHGKFKAKLFHEAIAEYRKVLDLKPGSVPAWLEMGASLKEVGLASEARSAWKEGLKYDSENPTLRALLGSGNLSVAVAPSVAPLVADDSLNILKSEKTGRGTRIEAAIKSVVSMTKSLGTPIVEKGWQIRRQGEKFLVSYLCEQSGGALESFDWLVDVDTRQAMPHNDNARLLMSRW